ncbi:MAG: hypothetical protein R3D02_06725 [Hyphomicrobiales bacterium]
MLAGDENRRTAGVDQRIGKVEADHVAAEHDGGATLRQAGDEAAGLLESAKTVSAGW